MTIMAWGLLLVYLLTLLALAKPLGGYLAKVADATWQPIGVAHIERGFYRLAGTSASQEMTWQDYALAVLVFNVLGVVAVFALQMLQAVLPLNPQHMAAIRWDSALNTAVSFVSNTNWQGYAGESTMSYLTQMLALTVQNFLSAGTGIAVAFALIRGFARRQQTGIGNFWVDLTRSTLYLLLPLSLLLALVFVSQGVIQTFAPYLSLTTLEGHQQTLALGPVASQEAIKMLGTNGGGFFNANSAHPFENPNAFVNFLQMLAIFLIPAALCHTFGRMTGDRRQGVAILTVMTVIFVVAVVALTSAEQQGNPHWTVLGIDQSASALQAGGNMEGKEVRFGIAASSLFTAITTAASCGAVNTMHDSLTPLGGLVPLLLMQLGEVVFGGVGSGLYGMLVLAIMTVFVAGLMIGRTPEYIGKKIDAFDMKMVALAILVTPLLVLVGTALSVLVDDGLAGLFNHGAHGFSEVLYALSSAANNNGSAFAGLSANTPYYNVLLAVVMFVGRFGVMVPILALAGSLAQKKYIPPSAGSLPTHGALFIGMLIGVIVLVGALTYLPALALGPVVDHLQLHGVH